MSENKFDLGDVVLYWGRKHKVMRVGGLFTFTKGQIFRYDLFDIQNGVSRFDIAEEELQEC